jgi:hypothetical protein
MDEPQSHIDDERSAVIRDLNFAGCVKSVSYVSRPDVSTLTHNATGDIMHTDGSVAVITLQNCRPVHPQLIDPQLIDPQLGSNSSGGSFKAGNIAFRYIRKQILTFRNDIWRANIIYGAYDVGRMAFTTLRHKPAVERQPDNPLYASSKAPSHS